MVLLSRGLLTVSACLALCQPALAQLSERVEGSAVGVEVESGPESDLSEKAAFIAQYDDGEADLFIMSGATTYEAAMLFENVGGSDVTLGAVDFCWRQTGGDTKIRYEVVIWAANGPGGTPGTELAKFAAVATGVSATPTRYSTTLNYSLTTSDVYIGVRYNPAVDMSFWFCVDTDGIGGAPAQPGYRRGNETGAWSTISSIAGASAYKALMVRAFLSTPGVFAEVLGVPYFLVDTTSPLGTTTLFAVRNLTDETVFADVEYYTRGGALQGEEELTLAPYDTFTRNLRDVPGLATGMDGFARGYVAILTAGNPDMTPVLAGDYFQVDVGNDFATGDKLFRLLDLCTHASIRFLKFPLPSSGTRLTVWILNPRGTGGADPPSFTVRAYDEAGVQVGGAVQVKTTLQALEFDSSTFTGLAFGTFRFDFTNSGGGTVYAEASAQGRFSAGVSSQCDEFP